MDPGAAPPAGGTDRLDGRWRIVAVQVAGELTEVPPPLRTPVTVSDGVAVLADTVNAHNGLLRVEGSSARFRPTASTWVGYGGRDPARHQVIAAVRALTAPVVGDEEVVWRLRFDTGGTVDLAAGPAVVTLSRQG